MPEKDYLGAQRRKYIRLDSVFPVQFRLISLDTKTFLSDWVQGFTSNVSKGGICLSVNNLSPALAKLLQDRQVKLSLDIELFVSRNPIPAIARVAWVKETDPQANKYLVGLAYEEINLYQNNKIIRYAWAKKLSVPVALGIIFILALGFTANAFINAKLTNGNKILVEQLFKTSQDSSLVKQKIKEISKDRQELQLKMYALQFQMQKFTEEKSKKEKVDSAMMKKLNHAIAKIAKEKNSLQKQLVAVRDQENMVTEELSRLDRTKARLEKANVDNMYKWLVVHQNPRTGLVMSFEGDKDIENWAFTYDQALLVQTYALFSNFERARKILDFFSRKAQRVDGRFLNAYYADDGAPAEYTVHSGPNIWLGIAIIQYTQKSEDDSYLPLAEEIAWSTIKLHELDPEGGIRGGPEAEWFATEHNLDAYAFFNMLYQVTGRPEYAKTRDEVLSWLTKHTYDKGETPIKRGKGDSTIATDTYAWSIAAIGPEKLEQLGMDPARIMEFAEQNCGAEVSYSRPDGQVVKIKGFDFAPQKHVARGGVVSSEWTAQMILSFKLMADFYSKKNMPAKARAWESKADTYMAGLANMIISSPSPSGQGESCLPYATQDYVDTGHGWMTPKGSRTGSVAGTAYTIFAYYKYNPLELKEWLGD